MTTLAITPNWKNKSAKFKGTVAAGEHVAVSIANDDNYIADTTNLRLRVVNPANGKTLAQFPMPEEILPTVALEDSGDSSGSGDSSDEWDSDLSPLRCTLNLNTVQMLKAVPPAANVSLLFVLDDYENKTLYFKEQFPVEHWPRLRGEEEPTDLDNYKDIIEDFNARLDGYDTRITGAENAAQAATENASAAAAAANDAETIANNAVGVAQQAKETAETSQTSAAASAAAAQNAANAAIAAAESINSPDATLAEEGVAADAKATGERIAAEETRAKAAEAAEESRAKAAEADLAANVSSAQKAISDEAELRAAADADLEANKADKSVVAAISADVAAAQTAIADRYTKSEVDAKVAGVQTFQKLVVNELPSAEAADYKTIYLVPRAGSETPDLCDEWTVVGAAGSRRWEKIGGGTAVDITLDDAVTNASARGVKSSGIWSAIWGALTALPGFSSLYDWCVAQLAGKASTADATLTPIEFTEWTLTADLQEMHFDFYGYTDGQWYFVSENPEAPFNVTFEGSEKAVYLEVIYNDQTWVASRKALGYILGSEDQSNPNYNKPLQPKGDYALKSELPSVPVTSVNGKTGAVTLNASDVEAVPLTNKVVYTEGGIRAYYNSRFSASDLGLLIGTTSAIHTFTTLYSNASISGWKFSEGTRATLILPFPWVSKTENTLALLSDIAVKSVKLNGVGLTPDANGAVNVPALPLAGGTMTGSLHVNGSLDVDYTENGITASIFKVSGSSLMGAFFIYYDGGSSYKTLYLHDIALLSDTYTVVQQIAPAFTSKVYVLNELCTYNNVVYRCKSGYTATTSSASPDLDTTHWEAKKVSELFAPLASPAFTGTPTAPTPASGDNSTKVATTAFVQAAVAGVPLRYDMPTAVALVAENDAATLVCADRAVMSATIAAGFSTLNLTFPEAISGKVRDFYLRIVVAAGESAPALSIPHGITIENPDGAVPEIADGETDAASTTLVWFSETAPNVFTAKSETVKAVA